MYDAAFEVVAAAGALAKTVQKEFNTPAMIAADQARRHAARISQIDACVRIMKNPNLTKQQKSGAYWFLMRVAS